MSTVKAAVIALLIIGGGHRPPSVDAKHYAAWTHVAWCETHDNWKHWGAEYEGGLGIYWWNWDHYGGLQYASNAADATPLEQMAVAESINKYSKVPEPKKCTLKGW